MKRANVTERASELLANDVHLLIGANALLIASLVLFRFGYGVFPAGIPGAIGLASGFVWTYRAAVGTLFLPDPDGVRAEVLDDD